MICNVDSVGSTNAPWKSVTHVRKKTLIMRIAHSEYYWFLFSLSIRICTRVQGPSRGWGVEFSGGLLRYFYTDIGLIKKICYPLQCFKLGLWLRLLGISLHH